ncbi:hypothetical protein [Halorubrum sp. CBA1229]|uniref:hypothetical protein n=1 Tax=Halorubrum sp. CBA1229 TaxID=1853699 RepID=UPI000F3B9942|nr:hypothetical protein [Halorubrum sp. CBA1229]QKY17730.1 hypothetical protein Hrr1229_012845 [Halorubrum sp. CBA1229]
MAIKTLNPRDIDDLFKSVVWAMAILAGGVVLLAIGAFTGTSAMNVVGYVSIAIAFVILILASRPAW